MRKISLPVALLLVFSAGEKAISQGTIHPSGYAIEHTYTPRDTTLTFGDTLFIERTLINDESFGVRCLYFSDNFPSEFQVVSAVTTINGSTVSHLAAGPWADSIVTGYNAYWWIVDSPVPAEGIQRTVNPGDTVQLQLKLVCSDIGNYVLPFHGTTLFGDGTGLFVVSDSFSVRVSIAADVTDDPFSEGGLLPRDIVTRAYPNPFNSEVTIAYAASGLRGRSVNLTIFNILGQLVYHTEFRSKADQGVTSWRAGPKTVSGVYFYQITDGHRRTMGKLMYLK